MQDYVPPQLFRLLKAQSWLHMVAQHVQQAQALSAHQARAQFLGEQAQDGDGEVMLTKMRCFWGDDAARDAMLARTQC